LKCALQPEIKKILYFGGSRSFKVINVDKSKKNLLPVLIMISSISVLICNRSAIRPANSGKITSF